MCLKLKVPVTPALTKHQLTKPICDCDQSFVPPDQALERLYSGQISTVPTTISGILKLTSPNLTKHYKYPLFGTKDQLAMKFSYLVRKRLLQCMPGRRLK